MLDFLTAPDLKSTDVPITKHYGFSTSAPDELVDIVIQLRKDYADPAANRHFFVFDNFSNYKKIVEACEGAGNVTSTSIGRKVMANLLHHALAKEERVKKQIEVAIERNKRGPGPIARAQGDAGELPGPHKKYAFAAADWAATQKTDDPFLKELQAFLKLTKAKWEATYWTGINATRNRKFMVVRAVILAKALGKYDELVDFVLEYDPIALRLEDPKTFDFSKGATYVANHPEIDWGPSQLDTPLSERLEAIVDDTPLAKRRKA